jgi:hypothetical protein
MAHRRRVMDTMEKIGTRIPKLPIDVEYDRCLLSHDGPILTIKISKKGERYLELWADCCRDTPADRWFLFRVLDCDMLGLLIGSTSLREVMLSAPDGFIYVADVYVGKNLERQVDFSILPTDQVPEDSLPTEDSFFEYDEWDE